MGKPWHGEDQGEESVPIRTQQITHSWPFPCPGSLRTPPTFPTPFPQGPREGPACLSPSPSAFQLFFTALQGQWVGGRERAASAFHAVQQPGTDLPLRPCHQPQRVPKSLVPDPALNGTIPRVMLQTQAQCLQIPRTV